MTTYLDSAAQLLKVLILHHKILLAILHYFGFTEIAIYSLTAIGIAMLFGLATDVNFT